jgi:hypothetical protein
MLAENIITGIFPAANIIELPIKNDPARMAKARSPENFECDDSLAEQPSFFHSAAWEKVLTETYGYTPICFSKKECGKPVATLSAMEADSWLTGRRGISLPFTDEFEPFGADKKSFQKVFGEAVEFGKSRGWKFLELRGGRKFFSGVPASSSFYGHSLKLAGDENHLFSKLESAVRRAIRRAENGKVTLEISTDLDAIKIFYSLHCQTRKRHGLPPQPFLFFQNIHRRVLSQNAGIVVLAFFHKKPVAGAVYFYFGDRAIYKFGASDKMFQHLRANNLVMWRAIQWFSQRGTRMLDFGRTSVANEGLRRFKLGWGAEERRIEYFKFDLRKNCFVAGNDESSGWHNRIFRALPVFASRAIGKVLYRHWA